MTKNQAARTAADSLEAIERYTRRTFYAALSCAILAGFLAMVAGMAGTDYLRAKWAMQSAAAEIGLIPSARGAAAHPFTPEVPPWARSLKVTR